MSASLVGSEMCIRDSRGGRRPKRAGGRPPGWLPPPPDTPDRRLRAVSPCLLYTSDAADDM
eukprot:7464141-Alexandrium_andersonii.AAC.1